jgi:hypothetical protein
MAKFAPRRHAFGRALDEDDPDGLPSPHSAKALRRRTLAIREAHEALARLPEPGESLHVLCTARLDLAEVVAQLLGRLGPCERVSVATLGYNERNLASMLSWLDSGAVRRLDLLASIFFRSHKGALWEQTLAGFRARGQRAACCHSHAKVVALHFASGVRMAIEGSANLCGNGSGREQFALFNDAALHDWHAAWINDLVSAHEADEDDGDAAG